jgi:DNA-binding beta-propeller fold protein YncE
MVLGSNAHAAPVQFASNGHYYEAIPDPSHLLLWDQMRDVAATMTFSGMQGHLATITSAEEQQFLNDTFPGTYVFALGGFQLPGSSEPAGGWTWITGEPFAYTNWTPGEPNDAGGGNENVLTTANWDHSPFGSWNDYTGVSGGLGGYFVEFEPAGGTVGGGTVYGIGGTKIYVIDPTTDLIVRTIPVPSGPDFITIDHPSLGPYLQTAYFTTGGGTDGIVTFDISTETFGRFYPMPHRRVKTVGVTLDQSTMFVADQDYRVHVVDLSTGSIIKQISVGGQNFDGAMSRDGTKFYVPHRDSVRVSVISTATQSVIKSITTAWGSNQIEISSDGNRGYVTNEFSGTLSCLDLTSDTTISTISVAGSRPIYLALSPDDQTVYIANRDSRSLTIVDAPSCTRTTVIPNVVGGMRLRDVAVSADGTRLYIGGLVEGGFIPTIAVYDARTSPPAFLKFIHTDREIGSFLRILTSGPQSDPPGDTRLEVSDIIRSRPTIVLTHGLSKADDLDGAPDSLWIGKGLPETWPLGASRLIEASRLLGLTTEDVNIVRYVWEDAFRVGGDCSAQPFVDRGEYRCAREGVDNAGVQLARKLLNLLCTDAQNCDYGQRGQTIHFIGHSMGSVVNAYAASGFLGAAAEVQKAQVTILEYPHNINKIPPYDGVCENDVFEESWYGVPDNLFALLLQDIRNGLEMRIDNYFAQSGVEGCATLNEPNFWNLAGVGDETVGPIYDHRDHPLSGLVEPWHVGDRLFFPDDNIRIQNDHSGVHQWYRWTIIPNYDVFTHVKGDGWPFCGGDGELSFVHNPFGFDWSLDPCSYGWTWALNGPFPDLFPWSQLGPKIGSAWEPLEVGPVQEHGCTLDEDNYVIDCREESSPFITLDVDIPEDAEFLSFEYRFSNIADGDYVTIFLDGSPIWKVAVPDGFGDEFVGSGPIPVGGFGGGTHKLLIALYGVGEPNAEFAMRNLQVVTTIPGIYVPIDIKPGDEPNSINTKSRGVIAVAILSTPNFDASFELDEASLTFGRTGNEPSLVSCASENVNSDGLLDLVCHFDTQASDFLPGDAAGVLRGETLDGIPVMGTDSVRCLP